MDKNKKIIIGLIFAITSILAGLSIYVSWQLRREVSPEDTSADITDTIQPTKVIEPSKLPTKMPTKTPTKVPAPTDPPQPTQPAGSGGTSGGGVVPTAVPSGPLPETALVNERLDAALLGSALILSGIVIYKRYFRFGGREESYK